MLERSHTSWLLILVCGTTQAKEFGHIHPPLHSRTIPQLRGKRAKTVNCCGLKQLCLQYTTPHSWLNNSKISAPCFFIYQNHRLAYKLASRAKGWDLDYHKLAKGSDFKEKKKYWSNQHITSPTNQCSLLAHKEGINLLRSYHRISEKHPWINWVSINAVKAKQFNSSTCLNYPTFNTN